MRELGTALYDFSHNFDSITLICLCTGHQEDITGNDRESFEEELTDIELGYERGMLSTFGFNKEIDNLVERYMEDAPYV